MHSRRIRLPTFVALVVVAVVIGVTIRFGTFVPWGTDSSAYIDAAHRWALADLFTPTTFVFWAPWSFGGHVEVPLGQTLGPTTGTAVGVYPLGYPLLLAAALKIGGSLAPYLVAPIFAGLLAWCAYVLASQLSGPWAGVMASVLIAATPVTLANAISPMSDVPAAALWAVSWVLGLGPGRGAAIAAGFAVAFAIMVRPNLAPLAGIVALVVVSSTAPSARRSTRLLVFAAASIVGPAMVLWSQAVLYGDPLTAGYGSAAELFSTERILQNLALYPHLFLELHGWLVVAGLLVFPLTLLRDRQSARIVLAAVGFIVINLALYLPFLTYEGWHWLRFMLPALLAVFVLFAASMDRIRRLLAARSRWLSALAVLPLLVVVIHPREEIGQVFRDGHNQRRVQVMGDYLREAVPGNAVVLTYLQSGAVAHYTGRPVIRLDYLDSTLLDSVVGDLRRRGYRPGWVIDDVMESAAFRARFRGSRFGALEWPARAEFWSGTSLSYFVPADRTLFLNDEIHATDVLRPTPARSSGQDAMPQRVSRDALFPPMHESLGFRKMLDDKYRDDLARPAAKSVVDWEASVLWLRRYLRYRLHACPHSEAMSRVFAQIEGHGVPPVCGRLEPQSFPPRDELVDFRRRLETTYRAERDQPLSTTHVDVEGDAVWTQEYLRHRANGCAHERAVEKVFGQIEGRDGDAGC